MILKTLRKTEIEEEGELVQLNKEPPIKNVTLYLMMKDWMFSSYDQEWSKDVHIVALIWHSIRNSRQCNSVRK